MVNKLITSSVIRQLAKYFFHSNYSLMFSMEQFKLTLTIKGCSGMGSANIQHTDYSRKNKQLIVMAVVVPEVTLSSSDGLAIPVIGMGTMSSPPVGPEITKDAIIEAIMAGYRHFDTAFVYRTEQPLGEAIAEALRLGLVKSRDELYISSKLWCSFGEKGLILPAINMSLR